jgi:predicted RecA/RadA family phage recombinase
MKNLVQSYDNIVQLLASDLVFPTHTTGDNFTNIAGPQQGIAVPINLVEGGDPVLCGRLVGVADRDALRSTDLISVYVRGVFNLAVKSYHNGFNKGETVYIDPSTAELNDQAAGVPFGTAMQAVASNAVTTIQVRLFGATPGATGANS